MKILFLLLIPIMAFAENKPGNQFNQYPEPYERNSNYLNHIEQNQRMQNYLMLQQLEEMRRANQWKKNTLRYNPYTGRPYNGYDQQ